MKRPPSDAWSPTKGTVLFSFQVCELCIQCAKVADRNCRTFGPSGNNFCPTVFEMSQTVVLLEMFL